MPDSPYRGLAERCGPLDRRHTRYRFDLDRDIDWGAIDAGGDFAGPALLADLGVDVAGVAAQPEAWRWLQRGFALAVCEAFIELEQVILDFAAAEHQTLGPSRSVELLCEEEQKHIEMFRRFAAALRAGDPAIAEAVDRVRRPGWGLWERLEPRHFSGQAARHYLFWLEALFFEDYTIYLHQRLADEVDSIQPSWLSMHAAHRREEEQHVVTDVAHLDSLELGGDERERISRMFVTALAGDYQHFFGLEVPRRLLEARFPALPLLRPGASLARSAVFGDLLTSRIFRRTRAAAPYLEHLAATRAPVPPPARRSLRGRLGGAMQAARGLAGRLRREPGDGGVTHIRLGVESAAAQGEGAPTDDPVAGAVQRAWSEVLGIPVDAIGPDDGFAMLGGDSQKAVEIHARLERHAGRFLDPGILVECHTISELTAAVRRELSLEAGVGAGLVTERSAPSSSIGETSTPARDSIAIIAMAGRFPGAPDLEAYWRLLAAGTEAIDTVPADRWDAAAWFDHDRAAPGKIVSNRGGFITGVGEFDPEAFGLTERDARAMDPQQRLLLELAAELIDAAPAGRSVGVFATAGWNDYLLRYLADPTLVDAAAALGNLDNMVASRIAQVLGFTGPAMTIDAACASSLATVDLACKHLRAGACEFAIAGGVELDLTPFPYLLFSKAGVLSASGRCRPFSRHADGFVIGEGAGALLLAPLEVALARRLPVRAVIRGSASGSDGGALSGMAPSLHGQLAVLRRAYRDAGVDPASLSYVEGHGTGTPIGDPIEVRALDELLREAGAAPGSCALGSVKGNIGHLFTAAGAAALIKVVLALEHQTLPLSLGADEPDPRIGFAGTPLVPMARAGVWARRPDRTRRAGVSAFGVGGTNCHVVIEEAPLAAVPATARDAHVLVVAAPAGEVGRVARGYRDWLEAHPQADLGATCAALARRGRRFDSRRALVVRSLGDALAGLADLEGERTALRPPRVAFVFSGPGSQYPGMARQLRAEPAFAGALAECGRLLGGRLEQPLERILYDDASEPPVMDRIELTQPVVFAIGYALARWLESLGVRPGAVLGHSAGEYIAACVAGALPLERALALVHARGQAMAATEPGSMLAAFAGEARVWSAVEAGPEFRPGDLGVAAVNDPEQVVLSGRTSAIVAAGAALEGAGIAARLLPIACAAHSPLMDTARPALAAALRADDGGTPHLPFYSTVTGDRREGALDRAYWLEHLRAPVRFADAVRAAAAGGIEVFLEVGASGGLTHCVERVAGTRAAAVPLLRREPAGWEPIARALGALLEAGVPVDMDTLSGTTIAPPPPYPYRRRPLWIGVAPTFGAPAKVDKGNSVPAQAADLEGNVRFRRLIKATPSLRDHVAGGRGIAPAAWLVDVALGGMPGGLEEVVIARPLEGDREVRAVRAGDEVRVESRQEEGDDWVEHLRGRVCAVGERARVDAGEAAGQEVAPERLYAHLAASGLEYGPAMRAVVGLRVGDGEVVAALEVPAGHEHHGALHPAIVDGAMQAIAGLTLGGPPATYLGFAIGRVRAWAPTTARCSARVRARTAISAGIEAFRCDVTIADEDGQALVEFRDVGLKRARAAALVIAAVEDRPAPAMAGALPGSVVLVGAEAAPGLRRALEDAGVHVWPIATPGDREGARAALGRLLPIEAVVVLEPDIEPLAAIAGALGDLGVERMHGLFCCGRQSPALAFTHALAHEQPGWACRAVEVDPADAAAIVAELESGGGETRVRWSGRQRTVAALGERLAPRPQPEVPRPGGVTWITGGQGGLGAAIARALAARGDRLLLTGRRAELEPRLAADLGDAVLYVAADVTDRGALVRARDLALERWGGIDALIHAAGVLDDQLVAMRDPVRAAAVHAAKIAGTEALLSVVAEHDLDLVVLLSSLAAVVGGPGQADYAAANAYLDQLAQQRDLGRTRLVAVDLGPWRDAGMVAGPARQAALTRAGLAPMSPAEGLAALWAAIASGARQVVATGVVAGREAELETALTSAPRPIVPTATDLADDAGVAAFLRAELAAALARPIEAIDPDVTLSRLGVDSLMAVAMVKKIERRYGMALHATLLFEHPTVRSVAQAIEHRRAAAPPAPRPRSGGELDPKPGQVDAWMTGDGLHRTGVAVPEPGPGEIAIEVAAAGVNFIDLLAAAGAHPLLGDTRFVPGHEVAGTVAALGPGAGEFTVGDPVMALLPAGGYARRVVCAAGAALGLPDGMTPAEGAASVVTGLTAILCIEEVGRVRAGERVLIQAAAGGTGTMCVQLARAAGAEIFGTASPEKHDLLRELGVHHCIDYRREPFDDAVRAIAGERGLDVVIDSLAGDAIARGLALLGPGGRFVEIGAAGIGEVPPVDPRALFTNDLTFAGCNVGTLGRTPGRLRVLLERLAVHLAAGTLRPIVGHRIPFAKAADAHRLLRERRNRGKVVLVW